MSYVESNLLKDEKVQYFSRPHGVVYAMPVFLLFLSILALTWGSRLPLVDLQLFSRHIYQWVSLFLLLLAIITGLAAYVSHISSEFAVTDKRVLMKVGLLRRKTLEIFLAKIEAIDVDQTVPGRLLNYGSVRVLGTGGTQATFDHVKAPLKFRKTAQQQIDHTLQNQEDV